MSTAKRATARLWLAGLCVGLAFGALSPVRAELTAEDVTTLNAARDEAKQLFRQRKFREAAAAYQRALSIDANDAPTYLNLGLCHRNLRNDDAALAALRRAVEIDATFGPPRLEIGNILLRQKRLADARAVFAGIKEAMPDSLEYVMAADNGLQSVAVEYANQAVRALQQRQFDDAARSAAVAIELSPDTFRPWYVSAMVEDHRKDDDRAETFYEEALARAVEEQDRADALRGLGKVSISRAWAARSTFARAQAHRRAAVDYLQQSIQADSSSHTSYISLGNTLFELDRLSGATDALIRAEQLRPRDYRAPLKLAEIYLRQERWQDAEQAASRAVEHRRRNASAHAYRAEALENLGRLSEAISEYEIASQDPKWRQRAQYKIEKIRERM